MAAEAATSPRRGGPPRRALLRSRAPVRRKGRCTNSCRSAAAVAAALVVEACRRGPATRGRPALLLPPPPPPRPMLLLPAPARGPSPQSRLLPLLLRLPRAAVPSQALAREATAPPRATKGEVRVPGPLGLPPEAVVVVAATEATTTAMTNSNFMKLDIKLSCVSSSLSTTDPKTRTVAAGARGTGRRTTLLLFFIFFSTPRPQRGRGRPRRGSGASLLRRRGANQS